MTFADSLHVLRIARGLTQREVALRLGCVPQAVSNWERGAAIPPLPILASYLDLLHATDAERLDVLAAAGARPEHEAVPSVKDEQGQIPPREMVRS